ncbi:MAG: GTPase domain-containing protein [Acidimicrobiales bacterium]
MRTSESAALRQKWIPTATPQHGYRRVLVIGTTGSGKTTLIRQLLGTSVERVPATSSAKTTTVDTEVVPAPGDYYAVATFMSRDEVRARVEDNLVAAALALELQRPERVAAFKLFEHEDQRLRLPYVLGDPGPGPSWHEPYASILGRLGELAAAPGRGVSADDEVALEEWYRADATIDAMADELVARIEQAILRLVGGQFVRGEGNWPDVWRVQHSDRAAFFDALRQVSSNEAALFGRLLTPIVNGLRLRGPFIPAWAPAPLRVTITDSEGLGHIAETAAALPSTLVERFDEVEAIVLVDNGSQPMQAASQAALRRIATAGHLGKVIICFTHLDQVGGPNIQWEHQRQALLHHSLEQALGGLASALGPAGRSTLKQLADERTFYLGSLDRDLDLHADRPMIEELHRLVTVLHQPDATAVPVEPSRLRAEQLVEAVRQTFGEFCGRWGNRLGQRAGGAAVHWNTLKAFAGRVAQGSAEEYGELRPVAELAAILADHLNRAAAGQGWGSEPTADLSDAFLREVNRSVLASARAHLITGPQAIWALAAACKHRLGAHQERDRGQPDPSPRAWT